MDWENLREKTLGEVGTSLVTEGAGVAGGFVGAAFVGRQIQNFVMPDANISGSITNAAMAWGANNLPKLAIWYLTRGYAVEPGEAVTPIKEAVSDGRKALAGSVVFDTLMRLANGGANPASASIMGWQVMGSGPSPEIQKSQQADVQRLIQENSALRTELNKALQRLAAQPVAPQVVQQPVVQQPVVQQPMVQQQMVQQPVVQQPMVQPAAPAVVAQPAPPVVRYTPVMPYSAVPPYGSPIPPYSAPSAPRPVARAERPVVKVEQRPPMVRAEEIVSQPTPPAVQERQRRFGAMQPPHVQERQKKFSFMAGEERDIASAFGML